MESRLKTLEDKVDKYSDLMNRLITTTELISQEMTLMRRTLQDVGDLKATLIQSSTKAMVDIKHLEESVRGMEEDCEECRKTVEGRFAKRDGWLATVIIGIILSTVAFLFNHKP